jgi:sugar lactone lactonase YvrE
MMTFTSAIVHLDGESGEVVNRYDFLAPGFCNDLIADRQGNVYATDSVAGVVYKLVYGEETLTEWSSGYASEASGGFSLNGIIMSPDESSVMVGRLDNGELINISVNMDGSAGDASVSQPAGIPENAGFDGLVSWRGFVAAVFDGGVVGLQYVEDEWVAQDFVPAGVLDFPTTLTIDNHGNLWVVEGQLGYLFDEDDSTNATEPFGIYRFSPQMSGLVPPEQ